MAAKSKKKIKNQSLMAYLLEEHAWLFMFIILPISMGYDIFYFLLLRLELLMDRISGSSQASHVEKVRKVQRQVQQWNDLKIDKPMCTARPSWKSVTMQNLSYKDRLYKIKVDLRGIISIDTDKRIVRVEPMVSIGTLNDYLIGLGWTLPVVPELDDLTIGGLVMGGGLETTSQKYGMFQHICKSYEMIMADGSVVQCSKDERVELYAAIPFSYGTLGFLTAVDLDIIPYKPYIKLTYTPVHSLDSLVNTFTKVTNDPAVDSVEGIMYTMNDGVVMSGQFVDHYQPGQLNRMGLWFKPWFYKYVQSFLFDEASGSPKTVSHTEFVPTMDFFHRHNKALFWLMENTFPFANHPVFRYLLGWTMPPKFTLLKLLHQNLAPKSEVANLVVQDFGYNLSLLKDALIHVDEETKVYPIWLCPARAVIPEGMDHLYVVPRGYLGVDIGIYGFSPIENFDRAASQKRMERRAIEHQGYVALYAETQLSRQDFYDMFGFNLKIYDRLRKQLKCEKAFPHVYDKISKAARD